MTATVTRPVSVDELRRAWHAVQAGHFRPHRTLPAAATPPMVMSAWVPPAGERHVVVLGSAGSVGATTVALALATAAPGASRVVECAPRPRTGLAAASQAELGVTAPGWTCGTRGPVRLERRTDSQPDPAAAPIPIPADGPTLTVVDVGFDLWQVLAQPGWLAQLVSHAPHVVVAARVSVPGLRRLESCLDRLTPDRAVVAAIGPPPSRWPKPVRHSSGPLLGSVIDADRLIPVPDEPSVARQGLSSDPLPRRLVAAGASLLSLLEGPSR